MAQEKLLTIREVAQELGITEKEVIDSAGQGRIPAYKIGGLYLRFKQEQIKEIKRDFHQSKNKEKVKPLEKLLDFFYFNDFYIVSLLAIILLLGIIFK